MRRILGLALGLLAAHMAPAQAAAITLPVYSAQTIREREPEFRSVIVDNYERVMRPALTPAEARKLRTIRWSFPTDPQQVMLDFRAQSTGQIDMPVASLLLLKDLATAEAWLSVNGYNALSLMDYVTIIRLNRLGQWPASSRQPMQALGIPANALNNAQVSARRDEILSKTILFIVAHEMGHLLHGFDAQARCAQNRQRCDYRALQTSEARADAFAVDLFRRIGLVPNSSQLFFLLASRLQSFPSEYADLASWRREAARRTHPVDSERIKAVAGAIEGNRAGFASALPDPRTAMPQIDRLLANLRVVAAGLEDRDITGMQLAWAKTMLPVDLQPRRTLQPSLRVSTANRSQREPFTGYFAGSLSPGKGERRGMEILFRQGLPGAIVGDTMIMGIRSRIEGRPATPQLLTGTMDLAGDTYDVRLVQDGPNIRGTYKSRKTPLVDGAFKVARNGQLTN